MEKSRDVQRKGEWIMTARANPDGNASLPEWALGQAMHDLEDEDSAGRDDRARQLVDDLKDERHDEYDDPDEGGEG